MAVEPPFGEFTDPNKGRNPHGIRPWIVEQVNEEIVTYYDENGGDPEISEADEHAFYWGDGVDPDEYPPIYKLPKEYCVYVLECDTVGFDEFSGPSFAAEKLRTRAEGLGYELSDDWVSTFLDSRRPFYVGYTSNPYARIREHTEARSEYCAKFTGIFPPNNVVAIHWISDEDAAQQLEQETANRLRDDHGYFVHPRPG